MPPTILLVLGFFCAAGATILVIAGFVYDVARRRARRPWIAAAVAIAVGLCASLACFLAAAGALSLLGCAPPESEPQAAGLEGAWSTGGDAPTTLVLRPDAPSGHAGTFGMDAIPGNWFSGPLTYTTQASGTWRLELRNGVWEFDFSFETIQPDVPGISATPHAPFGATYSLCGAQPPYQIRGFTFHDDTGAREAISFERR